MSRLRSLRPTGSIGKEEPEMTDKVFLPRNRAKRKSAKGPDPRRPVHREVKFVPRMKGSPLSIK